MVRPDNGGAYALLRTAISCANTRRLQLNQSLGDLTDADPDLAQKRIRGRGFMFSL
jgi:hypothetical protein